jgi:hypothetical protein
VVSKAFVLVAVVASFAGFQTALETTLTGMSSSGPQAAIESPLACVERLDMPVFPWVADTARLIATLSAAVKVGPDGRAAEVAFQVLAGNAGNGEIFKTPVERNLRDSKYSIACAGKTVTLVFDFIYATRSERAPGLQMVTFVAPNRFDISAAPRKIEVLNQPVDDGLDRVETVSKMSPKLRKN